MNNEEKIISMLETLIVTTEKIQTELTEFKQEMHEFKQEMYAFQQEMYAFQNETQQEISRIRVQQKENTEFIKAIRHAVEEIDAKTTNKDLSIAQLDRLQIEVAKHEGIFVAIKEAVS